MSPAKPPPRRPSDKQRAQLDEKLSELAVMSAMPMCAPGDVTELAILADALGVYVKHTELQSPVLQRFEAAKKAYFLRVGTALGVIQMMQGAPSGKPTGKAKAKRR